jgi:isocitrate dehydrogenase (NAD+)
MSLPNTAPKPTVTLLPGDGIGPEVVDATVRILEAAGFQAHWESFEVGAGALEKHGDPLPREVLESIRKCGVALKGPIGTPIAKGFPSVNVALRKTLDLYANLRPVKTIPGVKGPYPDVDIIMVRENTEDMYSGIEHVVAPGVVESIKVVTDRASTRIARFAFEYARTHGRKKVSAIHKANIMKLSDGLFIDCARRVAKDYPRVAYEEVIVDNAGLQLVANPTRFDVMLLGNLYGDILSDVGAGLVGGLGMVPSANLGEGCAVFEAVHGSAPDIAGQGFANPTAVTLAAAMLARHMGATGAADRIERAVAAVYASGRTLTRDRGGNATTREFTDAVIAGLG